MAEINFFIDGALGEVSAATFHHAIYYSVGIIREFDAAISGKSRGSLSWYSNCSGP
jgi:hypothetical protein